MGPDDDLLPAKDEGWNRCDFLPPSIFCPLAKSRFASASCKGGIESLRVEPHSHGEFAQDSGVPDVAQLTEARVEERMMEGGKALWVFCLDDRARCEGAVRIGE